ncbi:MAG: DUF2752 domain-containing protein, partial [Flavobacteriales bacterium]|nr:DUF2752 domain-containing protein [Flavobacteriales bacterium]
GVECAGCGLQRSVIYLLKGEFTNAFFTYPAIYTLLLMVFFLALHLKFNFAKGHGILQGLLILNVIIILTNYLLKFI